MKRIRKFTENIEVKEEKLKGYTFSYINLRGDKWNSSISDYNIMSACHKMRRRMDEEEFDSIFKIVEKNSKYL